MRNTTLRRSSWLRVQIAAGAVATLLLFAPGAAAASVAELGKKLTTDADFRVRTQAALALGSSGDGAAVDWLCKGLDDEAKVVRAASAGAMAKLNKGGVKCLETRLGREDAKVVQRAIQRALDQLKAPEFKIPEDAHFVVTLGKVTDETDRKVEDSVRAALREVLSGAATYTLVPANVSTAQLEKALEARPKAVGFQLLPKVSKPTYSGDTLSVKVSLSVVRLPGSSIKGSLGSTLSVSGVSEPDAEREKELAAKGALSVAKKFVSSAERFE